MFGDFNAHSHLWKDIDQSNTTGKCIEKVVLEVPGKFSTIELQIGPTYLLPYVTIHSV
jgi:hypothetical protein